MSDIIIEEEFKILREGKSFEEGKFLGKIKCNIIPGNPWVFVPADKRAFSEADLEFIISFLKKKNEEAVLNHNKNGECQSYKKKTLRKNNTKEHPYVGFFFHIEKKYE